MDTVAWKVAVLALCAVLVRCEPPPPGLSGQYGLPPAGNFGQPSPGSGYQQQQPQQSVTNSYGAPLGDGGHGGGHDEHQDYIDSQPKSYEFGYEVKDAASGNDFGRRETSDGETVRGEYRVQLPDGRTQIVTYTADWRTGFHADVRYEGVAQYPDQYPGAGQSGGGYNQQGNQLGNGYDYSSANGNGNGVDAGYNTGNHGGSGGGGGYNNYQNGGSNNYNSGYNYQFGSNSIEAGYGSGGGSTSSPSFGPSSYAPPLQQPQQAYGVPFH